MGFGSRVLKRQLLCPTLSSRASGFYCTVSWKVVPWEREPDVAVTVTVYWPGGVLLVVPVPLDPLPPHPEVACIAIKVRAIMPSVRKGKFLRFRPMRVGQKRSASNVPGPSQGGRPPWKGVRRSIEAVCTLVAMVSIDVAAEPLGVTAAGLKVQDANAGSPEQVREVDAAKALTGVMLTVDVAEVPLVMVALVGASEIVKSAAPVTVTATVFDVEEALLLSPA